MTPQATVSPPSSQALTLPDIEVWHNAYPQRDFWIVTRIPEFTSVCPKTGLPDFGTLTVSYIPDELCLELKSFKYYLLAYRQQGIFYEQLVNRMLDDCVKACQPRLMEIEGAFTPRGGLSTTVVSRYVKDGLDPSQLPAKPSTR